MSIYSASVNGSGSHSSAELARERKRSSKDVLESKEPPKIVRDSSSKMSSKQQKSGPTDGRESTFVMCTLERPPDWTQRKEKLQEFCSTVKRPDPTDAVIHCSDKMIIRSGLYASHVLMIGKYFSHFDPFRCPYLNSGSGNELNSTTSKQCRNFRAVSFRNLKAHLEARHNLHNVQLNFVCPCLKEHNNGVDCDWVEFDPQDMVFRGHLKRKHGEFYGKLGEDGDYDKYLRTAFPEWVFDTRNLFPSQIFPEKIVIPTVVKDRKLHGVCNVGACKDVSFPTCNLMYKHVLEVHGISIVQTILIHACPAEGCSVTQRAITKQIGLHVEGMHQDLLGGSIQFSENAKKKRAELEKMAISSAKRFGEDVTNCLQTPDEDAGIKPHFSFLYKCPVEKCNYLESNEDYMIWHIGAKHEAVWNVP